MMSEAGVKCAIRMPVQVKICGLTRPADALVAVESGATFLGLIFVPGTPRCLSVEQAAAIISAVQSAFGSQGQKPRFVGVFRNQSLAEIESLVSRLPLDFIQLHGTESAELATLLPLPVIRFVPLQAGQNGQIAWESTLPQLGPFSSLLLEPPKGSALSLQEWLSQSMDNVGQLQLLGRQFPLLLAGGLTPDNILTVLKTLNVASACPFALDVASGVESSSGVKDHGKIRQFCAIASSFESNALIGF